jgi:hypothetical protein
LQVSIDHSKRHLLLLSALPKPFSIMSEITGDLVSFMSFFSWAFGHGGCLLRSLLFREHPFLSLPLLLEAFRYSPPGSVDKEATAMW